MASETAPRAPTEKEAFFFLTILNSMKNAPDVDWELVASRAGYSNAACAKTRYGQVKKAIGNMSEGATTTLVKSRSNKKAVGSGTNVNASKVKKGAATKVKKDKIAAAFAATEREREHQGEDDDEGDDELMRGPIKQESGAIDDEEINEYFDTAEDIEE